MNTGRNAIAWNGEVFLVATGFDPVRAQCFSAEGQPAGAEFRVALEDGYTAWPTVGGRAGEFALAYALANNANNPKVLRTIRPDPLHGLAMISEPIPICDLPGNLTIYSEHGQVRWDGFRWLVGLRLQDAGAQPHAAIAAMREDLAGVFTLTRLTSGATYAGAPALVAQQGGYLDIGFYAGAGGYFVNGILQGLRGTDHQIVQQTHHDTTLAIWWDLDGLLHTQVRGRVAEAHAIGLTGGLAAAYNPATETTLVLAKDLGAHLVAQELDDQGRPLRDWLRLAYWDGIGDYLPSVCAGGDHWLVSYCLTGGSVVQLVQGAKGVPLRDLNAHLPDPVTPPQPEPGPDPGPEPPEPEEPDEPPVSTLPAPLMLVSGTAGQAPFTVQATAHYFDAGRSISWWYRDADAPWDGWRLAVLTETPEHFYTFRVAGTFDVRATGTRDGRLVDTDLHTITVWPAPVPEPEPPPVSFWVWLWRRLTGRRQ